MGVDRGVDYEPAGHRGVKVPPLDLRAFGGEALIEGIPGSLEEGAAAPAANDYFGLTDDTVRRAMLVVEDDADVRGAMLEILAGEAPAHWKVVAPDHFDRVAKLLYAAEELRRKVGVVFLNGMYQQQNFVGVESRHPFDPKRVRGWQMATAARLAFPQAKLVGPGSIGTQGRGVDHQFELHGSLTKGGDHRLTAVQELRSIASRYVAEVQ